jgi:hypothetical protein
LSQCPFVPRQGQQQKSRDKLLCPGTSRDKITFTKEHKKQEKDVPKQEKEVPKQEKDVSKQEKGRSNTGKDILIQVRTF